MNLISAEIENYCSQHTMSISPLLAALAERTHAEQPGAMMLVGHLEGSFLHLLVKLTQAKRILEIGTFTGYSALSMASALPDEGQLITCDIDPSSTALAREFWAQSPHGHKIDLRLAPALEMLEHLDNAVFDLIFIDADKVNYQAYWERCVPLLRQGGILLVDNVLWSGRVLAPDSESDHAIVAFNRYAAADTRVQTVMLSVRDGLLLAWKH